MGEGESWAVRRKGFRAEVRLRARAGAQSDGEGEGWRGGRLGLGLGLGLARLLERCAEQQLECVRRHGQSGRRERVRQAAVRDLVRVRVSGQGQGQGQD